MQVFSGIVLAPAVTFTLRQCQGKCYEGVRAYVVSSSNLGVLRPVNPCGYIRAKQSVVKIPPRIGVSQINDYPTIYMHSAGVIILTLSFFFFFFFFSFLLLCSSSTSSSSSSFLFFFFSFHGWTASQSLYITGTPIFRRGKQARYYDTKTRFTSFCDFSYG